MKSLKKFFSRLDKIAREMGVDTARIEIWFADEARHTAVRTFSFEKGMKIVCSIGMRLEKDTVFKTNLI